jgi:hypothetical protein
VDVRLDPPRVSVLLCWSSATYRCLGVGLQLSDAIKGGDHMSDERKVQGFLGSDGAGLAHARQWKRVLPSTIRIEERS